VDNERVTFRDRERANDDYRGEENVEKLRKQGKRRKFLAFEKLGNH